MAIRKRSIQPCIWQDPDFGTLSPIAQLIFIGLITQADDEGRFNGHPAVIRSQLFPYSTVDLDQVVDALDELIRRMHNVVYYELNGQFYGQFLRWKNHQVLREDRLQPSLYPAPPKSLMTGRCPASDGQPGTEGKGREVSKGSKEGTLKNYPQGEHPLDKIRRQLEEKGILKKTKLI